MNEHRVTRGLAAFIAVSTVAVWAVWTYREPLSAPLSDSAPEGEEMGSQEISQHSAVQGVSEATLDQGFPGMRRIALREAQEWSRGLPPELTAPDAPSLLAPPTLTEDIPPSSTHYIPSKENFLQSFSSPVSQALSSTWAGVLAVWPELPEPYLGLAQANTEAPVDSHISIPLETLWDDPETQDLYSAFMAAFVVQTRLRFLEQEGPSSLGLEGHSQDVSALLEDAAWQKTRLAEAIWSKDPHGLFLYQAGMKLRYD